MAGEVCLSFFDVVAAEGSAHDGDHAVGEVVLFAGAEAADERLGDDGRGDVEVDGFGDGPAAFAGVGYPGFEAGEGWVVVERAGGEVEQPGADDGALLPDVRDLGEVEVEGLLWLA